MDINGRIKKIKKYFISFSTSVKDGANVVAISREDVWDVPYFNVKQRFKVECVSKDGVLFFLTEIDNDSDCLFDAAEYVIDYNAELEKRKKLYHQAVARLKDIFSSEPVSKLENLDFVFKKKKTTKVEKPEVESSPEPVETENLSEPAEEEGSLMNFAQKLTGEK